jgi:hypothetical protein
LAALAAWLAIGTGACLAQEDVPAGSGDVALFASAWVCGEEPLAGRLRATVLLGMAQAGRPAVEIVERRQAFLDGLHEGTRTARRPSAAACGDVVAAVQARLAALTEGRKP